VTAGFATDRDLDLQRCKTLTEICVMSMGVGWSSWMMGTDGEGAYKIQQRMALELRELVQKLWPENP